MFTPPLLFVYVPSMIESFTLWNILVPPKGNITPSWISSYTPKVSSWTFNAVAILLMYLPVICEFKRSLLKYVALPTGAWLLKNVALIIESYVISLTYIAPPWDVAWLLIKVEFKIDNVWPSKKGLLSNCKAPPRSAVLLIKVELIIEISLPLK